MKKIIVITALAIGVLTACRENIDKREHANDPMEKTTSEYPETPMSDSMPQDHTMVRDSIH